MKILAVSDLELDLIYSPMITRRFNDVDIIIGCGDLPYYYLEYMISMLNKPLYYVKGNHAPRKFEETTGGPRTSPWGGFDLHRRVVCDPSTGLLMAGMEGSLRYNQGLYQYTQAQMYRMLFAMIPRLLYNHARYGRYLDVLVTHAPPWKIHDKDDRPHTGIKAFRWFIEKFKPAYHLHGHIHIYQQYDITETLYCQTKVINAYGYKKITVDLPKSR